MLSSVVKAVEYHSHDFDHDELVDVGKGRLLELQATAKIPSPLAADNARSLKAWQNFHHKNKGAFFHPRSYIVAAFPELKAPNVEALQAMLSSAAPAPSASSASAVPLTIMELGVGNGSNLFALSAANPTARLFASDFSRGALKFVRRAAERHAKEALAEAEKAVAGSATGSEALTSTGTAAAVGGPLPEAVSMAPFRLFAWDVVTGTVPPPPTTPAGRSPAASRSPSPSPSPSATSPPSPSSSSSVVEYEDWETPPPPEVMGQGCDAVLMTFVLSAIAPQHHSTALSNVRALMRPCGQSLLCFRDYGRWDAAQLRAKGDNVVQGSDGNLHVRGDGTLAYYFELEETRRLLEGAGFRVLESEYATVRNTNRKLGVEMSRVFVNAKAVPM